ncbi:hypothetical protein EON67_08050, partial [archaeon]
FLDTTALACASCGSAASHRLPLNTNTTQRATAPAIATSCACEAGYSSAPVACEYSGFGLCAADACTSCVALNTSAAVTAPSTCLPCDGTTLGLSPDSGDCQCPTLADGTSLFALAETNAAGRLLDAKTCVACPPGARVFLRATGAWPADRTLCQHCADARANLTADGTCVCPDGYRATGGNSVADRTTRCVPNAAAAAVLAVASEASAITISYYNVQESVGAAATGVRQGLSSQLFLNYYLQAGAGCAATSAGASTRDCQALANLCVLQLYLPSAGACTLFAAITNARRASTHSWASWPAYAPFLMYGTDGAGVLTDAALARTMSFNVRKEPGTSDTTQLYVSVTSLNGTFLGVFPLTTQLNVCATRADGATATSGALPQWQRFGVTTRASTMCDICLQHLIDEVEELLSTNIFTSRNIHFCETGIH